MLLGLRRRLPTFLIWQVRSLLGHVVQQKFEQREASGDVHDELLLFLSGEQVRTSPAFSTALSTALSPALSPNRRGTVRGARRVSQDGILEVTYTKQQQKQKTKAHNKDQDADTVEVFDKRHQLTVRGYRRLTAAKPPCSPPAHAEGRSRPFFTRPFFSRPSSSLQVSLDTPNYFEHTLLACAAPSMRGADFTKAALGLPLSVPILSLAATLGGRRTALHVYPTLQFLYSHHVMPQ